MSGEHDQFWHFKLRATVENCPLLSHFSLSINFHHVIFYVRGNIETSWHNYFEMKSWFVSQPSKRTVITKASGTEAVFCDRPNKTDAALVQRGWGGGGGVRREGGRVNRLQSEIRVSVASPTLLNIRRASLSTLYMYQCSSIPPSHTHRREKFNSDSSVVVFLSESLLWNWGYLLVRHLKKCFP